MDVWRIVTLGLVLWFVASLPLAMLVGRMLAGPKQVRPVQSLHPASSLSGVRDLGTLAEVV